MMKHRRVLSIVALALLLPASLAAQRAPGRSIGKVKMIGNLIHLELDSGAVTPERLFDMDHRTLRFIPEGSGYRVENVALKWDSVFGATVPAGAATISNFAFPFAGKTWNSLNIATGSVTFSDAAAAAVRGGRAAGAPTGRGGGAGGGGGGRGGFAMERYPTLQTVGREFLNVANGIAAFVKPGLNGERYMKELADRVVITWNLSEGAGGIQAFTWVRTVNRIQATLHRDGLIELSYNDASARDAVVGVFPTLAGGVEKPVATVNDAEEASVAQNLDVRSVTLTSIDGLFIKATIQTRGAVLPPGDPGINGVTYRIAFDKNARAPADLSRATAVWTIRGGAGGRGGATATAYTASGDGVEPGVTVAGNTITVRGILPLSLSGVTQVSVAADAAMGTPSTVADQVAPTPVRLAGVSSPEMDLSSLARSAGPFTVAYEGFHWTQIPRAPDVTCSIINALGDRFDLVVHYSDFRVDNPEGGTPSTGPRGGNISGIGTNTGNTQAYCSNGRLQWMYAQPVSMAAVQSQEKSPDGRWTNYNYAMSQVGHELGHRWAANASAIVNGETIVLGPTHWQAGVHLPSAFPYTNPSESDAMGGSTWKENPDGTYTQLDRDYYSPAKGWSWLALYLMGLAKPEEVKPFFILRNLQRTGQNDAEGHPIFRGDKTIITIENVIAAMGPRVPAFENAQKAFNTAMIVVTLPGRQPTPELLTAANNISARWIPYWVQTTGGRSTMTVNGMGVEAFRR